MIRRVLCLLLAIQLLLVQGLLSRACVGQCGQAERAGRPHVHVRQLCPPLVGQERPRCPCCQRKLEQSIQKAQAVESVCDASSGSGGPDDAVYLPPGHHLTAAGTCQKQTWADENVGVAAAALTLPAAASCGDGPPSLAAVPVSRPPDAPLYLLTLRLLV